MVECICGEMFRTIMEYKIHYLIGKPSVPVKSRLSKITDEQIKDTKRRLYDYEYNHQVKRKEISGG